MPSRTSVFLQVKFSYVVLFDIFLNVLVALYWLPKSCYQCPRKWVANIRNTCWTTHLASMLCLRITQVCKSASTRARNKYADPDLFGKNYHRQMDRVSCSVEQVRSFSQFYTSPNFSCNRLCLFLSLKVVWSEALNLIPGCLAFVQLHWRGTAIQGSTKHARKDTGTVCLIPGF